MLHLHSSYYILSLGVGISQCEVGVSQFQFLFDRERVLGEYQPAFLHPLGDHVETDLS